MKNPCSDCIVKVNCTQVCWAKHNNRTLLQNGINQCMLGKGFQRKIHPKYLDQYQKTTLLYNECMRDIETIKERARRVKGENLGSGVDCAPSSN